MAKASPMPTHQGLRSDDSDGPEHRWKPSIQQDQEQAIPICELDATPHPALQHNQLMTQRRVSASSRLFDLNGETDRVRKRQKSAIIAVDVRRFAHAINTDEVFGTHSSPISPNSWRSSTVAACRSCRSRSNSTPRPVWDGSRSMCCCPSPNLSAKSLASGCATRSLPPRKRVCGWAACYRSDTT